MIVHLIKTPELPNDEVLEIIEVLQSHKGPITFEKAKFEFEVGNFDFLDKSNHNPLTWGHLWKLCNEYRTKADVNKSDYVIILSKRKVSPAWYSAFDQNQNIFVRLKSWNFFESENAKYPNAYEVVANILQSQMGLSLDPIDDLIHQVPVGCMNDFCGKSTEVHLRLRTADICPACMKRIEEHEIDKFLFLQVIRIFNAVRVKLLFQKGLKINLPIEDITVDHNGLIEIGGLTLHLTDQQKALYILYLVHVNGIKVVNLLDFKESLLGLYETLKSSGHESAITNLKKYFTQNRKKIEDKIKHIFPDTYEFYTIHGLPKKTFGISQKTKRTIDPECLKYFGLTH